MGLANIVPGVSGGTMILALGLYGKFIDSISDISKFKIKKDSVIFLLIIGFVAIFTILASSSVVKVLMEMHLTYMLSLFIGLTIGGVPVLLKKISHFDFRLLIGFLFAFLIMIYMSLSSSADFSEVSFIVYILGGILGSAAMILPGISGSYLLLLLGIYLPLIKGISAFKDALISFDLSSILNIGFFILFPVSIGIILGVVSLSNLLKFLLNKHSQLTYGILLGLLLGSVFGLYPFKQPSLTKIIKYSIENNDGTKTLTVIGFGWEKNVNDLIYNKIKEIEKKNLKIKILYAKIDGNLEGIDIEQLKENKAILVLFNHKLSQIQQNHLNIGIKVPVIQVPDTSFKIDRLIYSILFMIIGMILTIFLTKYDRDNYE